VSRAWVDLVLRGAGHQTSLFSIRPPEVQHRASLEGSSTERGVMRSCTGDAARLQFSSEAVLAFIRIGPCDRSALEAELDTSSPIRIHVADWIRLSGNGYESRSCRQI
jgi:hypothetical protein